MGFEMRNGIACWAELRRACMGCGLCEGAFGLPMEESSDGFLRPICDDPALFERIKVYCPAINYPTIYDESPWGRYERVYLGWSTKDEIRVKASSGGLVTSVLTYVLEEGIADRILQIGVAEDEPLFGSPVVSETPDDVLSCCGSRYVACSVLSGLSAIKESDKKFAVVGKPCEMRALDALLRDDSKLASKIVIRLSFFCAGTPSRNAARKLLATMGKSEKTLLSFKYRGDGWPGFARATDSDGDATMSYSRSWGDILGRDIEDYCKFCFDGVGEYADISAGDAWFLSKQGCPEFSEGEGRNVIFARTKGGLIILESMKSRGLLYLEDLDDWGYLQTVQKAQFERKALLASRLGVLRLLGKHFQSAEASQIRRYAVLPLDKRVKSCLGLLKRLALGRIDLP